MTRRPGLGANFWKLFSASMATNLGDGLVSVATVWLATSITRDGFLIGLVALANRLPWLLFSLPAGVITDRFDRRTLVVASDVARCVVMGAFGLLVWAVQAGLPTPEQLAAGASAPAQAPVLFAVLCAVSFALGMVEVVRDNTAQTLMPSVVDKAQLERANGRLWGAEVVLNSFVGPPLAGVLITVALAWPFGVNAALFGVSAVLVATLRGSFAPRDRPDAAGARPSWRAELVEGFRWLWGHRLLRTLALLLGCLNLFAAMAFTMLPLFAQEVLGLFEGWQFGALLTGFAAGAVLGAVLAERVAGKLTPGRALGVSIVGMGLQLVLTGAASSAVVVWLISALGGFFIMVWNVVTVSLRQRIIPDHLLGRVNSVYRFFGWGMMTAGPALGGLLVTLGEPLLGRDAALRAPYLVAGVATLALLLVAVPRLSTARIRAAESA